MRSSSVSSPRSSSPVDWVPPEDDERMGPENRSRDVRMPPKPFPPPEASSPVSPPDVAKPVPEPPRKDPLSPPNLLVMA